MYKTKRENKPKPNVIVNLRNCYVIQTKLLLKPDIKKKKELSLLDYALNKNDITANIIYANKELNYEEYKIGNCSKIKDVNDAFNKARLGRL